MRVVIQRVKRASVKVDGECVGKVGKGLMLLLGVYAGDTEEQAEKLASKISKLRIFSDENGKLNLSVSDIGGGALVVSNFTLCANYKHGNRPDYLSAEKPERANELYEFFTEKLRSLIPGPAETGVFGADMELEIINDGPVTIVMDSDELK